MTQLKKEINILENGVKLLLIEEGVDNINQSSLWRTTNSFDVRYGYIDSDAIKNVFQLSDMPDNSRFNKWLKPLGIKGMYFKDGSCVAIGNDILNASYTSEIYLDTNCDKGPNIPGYDRFIAYHDTWNGPKNLLMNQLNVDRIDDINSVRNEFKELKNYNAQDADEKILQDVLIALNSLVIIIYDGWEINY